MREDLGNELVELVKKLNRVCDLFIEHKNNQKAEKSKIAAALLSKIQEAIVEKVDTIKH